MARGYRDDGESRCTRCNARHPAEDLFITEDAALLCPPCRVAHGLEESNAVRDRLVKGLRPEYRLCCPTCAKASMHTVASVVSLTSTCRRCRDVTTRMRYGPAFTLLLFAFLVSLPADAIVGISKSLPVISTVVLAIFGLGVLRDVASRLSYQRATLEQVEQADREAHEAKLRAASERMRIIVGGSAVPDAEPRAEAPREASAEDATVPTTDERGSAEDVGHTSGPVHDSKTS